MVSDIGLRLQEGIQDLHLEQQLAPAREAVTRTLTAGSTNFFKAVEGVRGRWTQRTNSSSTSLNDESKISRSSTPIEITKADVDEATSTSPQSATRPLLLSKHSSLDPRNPPRSPSSPLTAKPNLAAWGAGIGSFISTRAPKFSLPLVGKPLDVAPTDVTPVPSPGTHVVHSSPEPINHPLPLDKPV